MKPEKMDDEAIQSTIRVAIRDAISHVQSNIAPQRDKAQKAYNGDIDLKDETGRSKVKATKCRDMVRMVKPALMRMFTQSYPVEYVPKGPNDVQAAQQATAYARWKFDQNNGFSRLHDVFQDALVKKQGILKVYWDEAEDVEVDEFSNISAEQLQMALQRPGVQLLEYEPDEEGTLSARVARTNKRGRLVIDSLPPEDFFVDEGATSLDEKDRSSFYVCGDSTEMRVGDLVEMGFDFETVYGLAVGSDGDETLSAEDITRKGYDGDTDNESHNDPSMRKIVVVEAYMHMDIEGTGVPRLYQFVTAGTNYTILDYEPCDMVPYCVFECDPEPHAFFGHAPVEYIIDDQTASSSLLRGIIDNIHMSNTPRLAYDPELAKTEDILNNEIGALIRTKGLPGNAILPLGVPFMAHQTLPAMQYFDEQIDAKTGVSRSMSGMAADTLQNATARGVQAAVEAQSAAMELMARHLAEGGMTDVFRKIHRIIRQRAPADEVMMINGSFVPVDPSSWSADMDVKVNVGLGTNQREERMAMLQAVKMDQDAILQTYGPQNPFVTLTQARNVRADLMEMSGLHDATRYYQPMTPEIEQQVMQNMAAQSQGQQGGDPNAAFLQAEQMKAQQRAQSDQMKYTLEAQKVAMQDDRERDKMAQDRVMEAIKILGEYGLKVDQQAIQAEQAAQRQFGNQPR